MTGKLSVAPGVMQSSDDCAVAVTLTDVNNNSGLTSTCNVTFQVDTVAVNPAIASGWQTGIITECGEAVEVQFFNSDQTGTFGGQTTVGSVSYPSIPTTGLYNVRAQYNANEPVPVSTGALTQGEMFIEAELEVTSGVGSSSVYITIQRRSGSTWVQAVDSNGSTINNIQLTASIGFPGTVTKTFDTAGEYRLISTQVGGEACVLGSSNLNIDFGDANP